MEEMALHELSLIFFNYLFKHRAAMTGIFI